MTSPSGSLRAAAVVLGAIVILAASRGRGDGLPDLPDRVGRAGMMAAVVTMADGRQAVLAAGGANFPDRPPWDGGTKVFHDDILLLDRRGDDWGWRRVGRLPRPTAYAAFCASHDRGALVVAGGCAADGHHDAVLLVTPEGRVEPFAPPLPDPLAYAGFCDHQGRLVIIGGTTAPNATSAEDRLLSLSLSTPAAGWSRSAPDRRMDGILFLCGSFGDELVWGGGCGLSPGHSGVRRHYRDSVFRERLAVAGSSASITVRHPSAAFRLDGPLAAPAGPAVACGTGLLIVGGDDGRHSGPPEDHPGQSSDVRFLDPGEGSCRRVDRWPTPIVTAPLLRIGDDLVTVSGESRPGVRTAAVSRRPIPSPGQADRGGDR